MKQCFGYVRVSTQKQGEGVSLEAQKEAINDFAVRNNIAIIKWFEEQQTAAKKGRPEFNVMIKALRRGAAAGMVIHKIDRGARNYFDYGELGELSDAGIDVHIAVESLDFNTRGGRLAANVQMAVAEDYCRNLREEVRKGQRTQLKQGLYPFYAPIGYRNNGKGKLKTIDPVKGPLVKLAFELYGSGQYSLHSLRREMAKHGLAKSSGEPISKGCIEKFLANPFYTGVIRIKKAGEVFQGAHEPLISAELFERVQQIKAGKSGKKITRHNHLFRALFACGQCGRSMIPEKQKGYVYYRCQYPQCPRNIVREEPLDDAIWGALSVSQFSDETIALIEARIKKCIRIHGSSIDPKTIAMRLAEVDGRIEKLEDAAIEQIIDKATFDKRKGKLLLEKAKINKEAHESAEFYQNPQVIAQFLERLKSLAEYYRFAPPPEKREIVEIAVSNRKVTAKNVSAEPSNWLRRTQWAVGVLSCAHARTTSRTPKSKIAEEQAVAELAELARSPETKRLYALLMDGYKQAAFGDRNCQPKHQVE